MAMREKAGKQIIKFGGILLSCSRKNIRYLRFSDNRT